MASEALQGVTSVHTSMLPSYLCSSLNPVSLLILSPHWDWSLDRRSSFVWAWWFMSNIRVYIIIVMRGDMLSEILDVVISWCGISVKGCSTLKWYNFLNLPDFLTCYTTHLYPLIIILTLQMIIINLNVLMFCESFVKELSLQYCCSINIEVLSQISWCSMLLL